MPKPTKTQFTIAGIGELLWDMLPEGKQLGGAPINFAFHTQSLGSNANAVSAIGNDTLGNEIIEQFTQKNLNPNNIQFNDKTTGTVDLKITDDGQPTYSIHENVAWDHIQFTPELKQLAQKCDAVCFGSLAQRNECSRNTISEFLQQTNPYCLRIFDINLRQNFYNKEIIEHSFELANILKLNDEELLIIQQLFTLPDNTDAALDALMNRYNLDCIALTQGSKGSIMKDKQEQHECLCKKIEVKDTIGAGDSFTATMVMGKLYGIKLSRINQLASNIAAFVCTQAGATPQLPDYLIEEFINEIPTSAVSIINAIPDVDSLKQHARNINS